MDTTLKATVLPRGIDTESIVAAASPRALSLAAYRTDWAHLSDPELNAIVAGDTDEEDAQRIEESPEALQQIRAGAAAAAARLLSDRIGPHIVQPLGGPNCWVIGGVSRADEDPFDGYSDIALLGALIDAVLREQQRI